MRSISMVLGACVAAVLAAAVVPAGLGGCVSYKSDGPLVDLNAGRSARPEPGNIPRGPEHAVCRDEMSKALGRIDRLDKDLRECKTDRQKDKDKWEAEKDKLKRERDGYKDDRDMWKKRYENLRG